MNTIKMPQFEVRLKKKNCDGSIVEESIGFLYGLPEALFIVRCLQERAEPINEALLEEGKTMRDIANLALQFYHIDHYKK